MSLYTLSPSAASRIYEIKMGVGVETIWSMDRRREIMPFNSGEPVLNEDKYEMSDKKLDFALASLLQK